MKRLLLILTFLIPLSLMAEKDVCVIEYPKNCDMNFTFDVEGNVILTYTCKNKDGMYLATDGLKQKFFSQLFTLGRPKLFYVKTIFKKRNTEGYEVSVQCE